MKKVLVVSDLHCGSIYSPMPDEVWIEKGDSERSNVINSNPLQKRLFEWFQQGIDYAGKVDACFVLGDSVDGPNRKSTGFELWTSNLHQQCKTAADILAMIKTSNYFGVQGSYYHVGENTSSDLAIIEMLHGKFGSDLVVEVDGKRCYLWHEVSYSTSPISKATAGNSHIVGAKMNEDRFGKFDILLAGHTHEFRVVRDINGYFVNVPGWKSRDAYIAKKGLRGGGAVMVGFIILTITDGDIHAEPWLKLLSREQLFRECKV